MKNDNWVDQRLSALEPSKNWRPNAASALARMWERDRAVHVRRVRWIWGALAAAVGFASLLVLTAPQACAQPRGCSAGFWQSVAGKRAVPPPPALAVAPAVPTIATPPAAAATISAQAARPLPPTPSAPAPAPSFKQSGLPSAAITCEIYSDYQCPACAQFFANELPLLVSQYVDTGKVKLVHRDFPLPVHPFARQAARYANAAGLAGMYDAAIGQIFKTQAVWSRDGDIGTQLALALPPEAMRSIEGEMRDLQRLDDLVAPDLMSATADAIHMTPSLVVVAKGKREVLAPIPAFPLLRSYLDDLLAAK